MILDSFELAGKVAIVSGCDTGLGQGMARALAQAGADIVGVNVSRPRRDPAPGGIAGPALPRPARQPGRHRLHRGPGGRGPRLGRAHRHPGQQRRHHPPRRRASSSPRRTGTTSSTSTSRRCSSSPRPWRASSSRRAGRQDRQRGLDAVVPGRRPRAQLHGQQERRHGHHAADGQRVGGPRHQRQRHRAGLHGHQQHGGLRADEKRNAAILERIPAGRWGSPTTGRARRVPGQPASDYVNGYTVAVDGGWLAS
jgi:2-dehydro-3-deoxy-D-gluconate 5-dehydrogenase